MQQPSPQNVRAAFSKLMATDPAKAVSYLHELGISSGYLHSNAQAPRIRWEGESSYGQLECTINLAKPEKDPLAIAAEAAPSEALARPPAQRIPQCDLCWENEGFRGTPGHPAKPGLRIAAITLGDERWGLQYSPYAYFTEHCIALSEKHRPMKIDEDCIERLLDFSDLFPFYFIGSNADLPIVGGSILSHDHFQGGRHVFPLMKAPVKREVILRGSSKVRCGIVDWPASVLRLSSHDRAAILQAASKVLDVWRSFSNEACSIVAASDAQHNSLNPILTRKGADYIMDLVLRNNRTDAQHPWGIFHAPETAHHIKKENIGLIEVMGMAILPPRLAKELPLVQSELMQAAKNGLPQARLEQRLEARSETASHAAWAGEVYLRRRAELGEAENRDSYGNRGRTDAFQRSTASAPDCGLHRIIQQEVAHVYASILASTGVFKHDAKGAAGWDSLFESIALQ